MWHVWNTLDMEPTKIILKKRGISLRKKEKGTALKFLLILISPRMSNLKRKAR